MRPIFYAFVIAILGPGLVLAGGVSSVWERLYLWNAYNIAVRVDGVKAQQWIFGHRKGGIGKDLVGTAKVNDVTGALTFQEFMSIITKRRQCTVEETRDGRVRPMGDILVDLYNAGFESDFDIGQLKHPFNPRTANIDGDMQKLKEEKEKEKEEEKKKGGDGNQAPPPQQGESSKPDKGKKPWKTEKPGSSGVKPGKGADDASPDGKYRAYMTYVTNQVLAANPQNSPELRPFLDRMSECADNIVDARNLDFQRWKGADLENGLKPVPDPAAPDDRSKDRTFVAHYLEDGATYRYLNHGPDDGKGILDFEKSVKENPQWLKSKQKQETILKWIEGYGNTDVKLEKAPAYTSASVSHFRTLAFWKLAHEGLKRKLGTCPAT